MLLWMAAAAWACGQSTHVWVLEHALAEHVPPSGALHDLVSRPELFDLLVNGAMFPDGGYSPLADHGYGETAHWEPFQTTYLAWIAEQPAGLARDEHLALVLGMAAHGMADQVFDGVYLPRSQVYDADSWAERDDVDTVTDVAMAAAQGARVLPEDVVPYGELPAIFARHGVDVDEGTIRLGQSSLRLAIAFVGNAGSDPSVASTYTAQFPWANEHLVSTTVPGSPACIGEVVVRYWQTMLDRLDGSFDPDRDFVLATLPADGATGHPTDALDIESRLTVVFARALEEASVEGEVVVRDGEGRVLPIEASMYYGQHSNVLNIWPLEDWPDGPLQLALRPGITSFDGDTLAERLVYTFNAPVEEVVEEPGCGCRHGGGGWAWLLLIAAARRTSPPSASCRS